MSIEIAVPQTISGRQVVVGEHRFKDPVRAVRDRLEDPWIGSGAQPLAREALDLLRSPLLEIKAVAAAGSGLTGQVLDCASLACEREFLESAGHHFVITCRGAPGAQPAQARAARVVARALSEEVGGLVVDLVTGEVLEPFGFEHEPRRWVLGHGWCRVRVDGTVVRTAGLGRFGLPELRAASVPADLVIHAMNLLRALAYRLLEDHWTWIAGHPVGRRREIPGSLELESTDLWRYWGSQPLDTGALGVRLDLLDGVLMAEPTDGWTTDLAAVQPSVLTAAAR
ncbi:MAG: hypothetical protein ABIQ26_04115 [Streptosporangiaceae bacterium]